MRDMENNTFFLITAFACIAIPTILGFFLEWESAYVDRNIIISLLLIVLRNQMGGTNENN